MLPFEVQPCPAHGTPELPAAARAICDRGPRCANVPGGARPRRSGPLHHQMIEPSVTRSLRHAFLALTVLATLLGCRAQAPRGRGPRLVLLYATCTVNREHLAPYNPAVGYTPRLASFAQQARVFMRHQTEEGMSGPSFASILTGTQADRHGIFSHPARLAEANHLITEAFTEAGWETWFFDDHPIASADIGYAQGVPPHHVKRELPRGDSPAFQHILERLREDERRRALVVTAFTVSHGPYALDRVRGFAARHPEACGGLSVSEIKKLGALYHDHRLPLERDFEGTAQKLRLSARERDALVAAVEAIYASRIEYLDELFGTALDAIDRAGLAGESLIAFTADHGEILYRENAPFKWTHGYMLEPDDLTVPLLLRAPVLSSGRYEGVSRSIDVFPTLAGLAGIALAQGSVDGVDLSAALLGRAPEPRLPAFSHTMLVPHEVYARSGGWKTFRGYFRELDAPGMWVALREGDLFCRQRARLGKDLAPELYDLGSDPGLVRNLYDAKREAHIRLARGLADYKRLLVDAHTYGARAALPSGEERQRLETLGYIERDAAAPTPRPSAKRPSPR
jgi:arylsulfatase A-like enzyme